MTQWLTREVGPDGIHCTVVRVGRTEGGEFREHWDPQRREFALTRPQGSIVDVIPCARTEASPSHDRVVGMLTT